MKTQGKPGVSMSSKMVFKTGALNRSATHPNDEFVGCCNNAGPIFQPISQHKTDFRVFWAIVNALWGQPRRGELRVLGGFSAT
jgi:hypothetical protein